MKDIFIVCIIPSSNHASEEIKKNTNIYNLHSWLQVIYNRQQFHEAH